MKFTATVRANGSGTPTGSVDFVDTTNNADLGTVALSGGVATLTTSALGLGAHAIRANYLGDGSFLPSLATLTQTVTQSIYVLNKGGSGALTLSGKSSITIPGTLFVDSNSKTALTESGNVTLTAASVQVVGGVKISGKATMSPAATTGVAYVADPLAALAAPTGGTARTTVTLTKGTLTINPGVYKSISVSGTGSLTLNPGVYIIEGGGLTVSGHASLSGTGVMIYNAGGDYDNGDDDRGGITLSGDGTFNITAPTSGTYAGIAIFQARDNTRAITLSKNAVAGIGGTIYAPLALLYLTGDASLNGALIVNKLSLSGDASSTQSADGSDVSAGDNAGQLLQNNLLVYVNDPNTLFTSDEQARIQDAVSAVDAVVEPFGVSVAETTDPTAANVVIDTESTSPVGGYADGILGCWNPDVGEITMLQGWSWYAGSDATQIGAGQYDFQTTLTHELGHALGLGESTNTASAMSGTLATGTVVRTLTTTDLSVPDVETAADAQRAAVIPGTASHASPVQPPAAVPAPQTFAQPLAGTGFAAAPSIGPAPAPSIRTAPSLVPVRDQLYLAGSPATANGFDDPLAAVAPIAVDTTSSSSVTIVTPGSNFALTFAAPTGRAKASEPVEVGPVSGDGTAQLPTTVSDYRLSGLEVSTDIGIEG